MAHLIIARKYRPKNFDEVVYQEHITKTLQNAIKSGRLAQAYIFSGPRGVGKTSMARIFSRSLNCEKGPTESPCGQCDNCREITQGSSLDVIEIDGASNTSVDNVRELRENAKFSAVKSRYKVYIIDEVHMLSQAAFNALLKILEEPPSHIIFMLATTEIHKIPATILSRCQRFQFRRIPCQEIVASLMEVVKAEGYEAQEEALYWIARQSGGSLRDAQSILEQVMAFSGTQEGGRRVQSQDVKELLGITDFEMYRELLSALDRAEAGRLLAILHAGFENGLDAGRFVQGFLEYLRILLLVNHGIEDEGVVQYPKQELRNILPALTNLGDEEIHFLFELLRSLLADFRLLSDSRVLVEMAMLRAIDYIRQPNLASLLTQFGRLLGGDLHEDTVLSPASGQPLAVATPVQADQEKSHEGNLEGIQGSDRKASKSQDVGIEAGEGLALGPQGSLLKGRSRRGKESQEEPGAVQPPAKKRSPEPTGAKEEAPEQGQPEEDLFAYALDLFHGTEITEEEQKRMQQIVKHTGLGKKK